MPCGLRHLFAAVLSLRRSGGSVVHGPLMRSRRALESNGVLRVWTTPLRKAIERVELKVIQLYVGCGERHEACHTERSSRSSSVQSQVKYRTFLDSRRGVDAIARPSPGFGFCEGWLSFISLEGMTLENFTPGRVTQKPEHSRAPLWIDAILFRQALCRNHTLACRLHNEPTAAVSIYSMPHGSKRGPLNCGVARGQDAGLAREAAVSSGDR
ncbi:hypothetical protein C8Q74DRAFT_1014206 [Fomes fomentarius]|nr:hypothetical protein C8Q74DRAFT_1014206 [Fomes fomentarius]